MADAEPFGFRTRQAWLRTVTHRLRMRYGTGTSGAWAHMSEDQRADAVLAEAAQVIMAQDESVAEGRSFADAVRALELIVSDFTGPGLRLRDRT